MLRDSAGEQAEATLIKINYGIIQDSSYKATFRQMFSHSESCRLNFRVETRFIHIQEHVVQVLGSPRTQKA